MLARLPHVVMRMPVFVLHTAAANKATVSAGIVVLIVIVCGAVFGGVIVGGIAFLRYRAVRNRPKVKEDLPPVVIAAEVFDERTGERTNTVSVPLTLRSSRYDPASSRKQSVLPPALPAAEQTMLSFHREHDAPLISGALTDAAGSVELETEQLPEGVEDGLAVTSKKGRRRRQPRPSAEERMALQNLADSAGGISLQNLDEIHMEAMAAVHGANMKSVAGSVADSAAKSAADDGASHKKGSRPPSYRSASATTLATTTVGFPGAVEAPGAVLSDAELLSIAQEHALSMSVANGTDVSEADARRTNMLLEVSKATLRRLNKSATTPWGQRKAAAANMIEQLRAQRDRYSVRDEYKSLTAPHADARMGTEHRLQSTAQKVAIAVAGLGAGSAKSQLRNERDI
jgi:hypothetical protein